MCTLKKLFRNTKHLFHLALPVPLHNNKRIGTRLSFDMSTEELSEGRGDQVNPEGLFQDMLMFLLSYLRVDKGLYYCCFSPLWIYLGQN